MINMTNHEGRSEFDGRQNGDEEDDENARRENHVRDGGKQTPSCLQQTVDSVRLFSTDEQVGEGRFRLGAFGWCHNLEEFYSDL